MHTYWQSLSVYIRFYEDMSKNVNICTNIMDPWLRIKLFPFIFNIARPFQYSKSFPLYGEKYINYRFILWKIVSIEQIRNFFSWYSIVIPRNRHMAASE